MTEFFNSQYEPIVKPATGTNTDNSTQTIFAHVSLAQIVHNVSKEESLVISGQKINSIIAIGVVISVEELTTKNIYSIEDYTNGSPIEVQLWKNDNNEGYIQ